MDKATFLEMMDQYIDGTLSSAEKNEFDQMINNDPSLKADFDLHKSIRSGIKKTARFDLKDELDQIKKESQLNDTKVKPLIPTWIVMGIAAVFVAIIAVIFIFRENNSIEPSYAYIGKLEMKVLPKEGNLGGVNNEQIHVILKSGVVYEYVLTQDSLILYADPKLFNTFKNMDPVITLNQQRNIAIEIKNNKYLFKPKNAKDE